VFQELNITSTQFGTVAAITALPGVVTALIFGVLLDHVGITVVGISVAFLIVLGQVLVAVAVQIQSYGLLVGARLIFGAGYCPLLSTLLSSSAGGCFSCIVLLALNSFTSVGSCSFVILLVAVAVHFVAIWFHGPQMAFAFGIFLTSIRLGDFFIYGVGTTQSACTLALFPSLYLRSFSNAVHYSLIVSCPSSRLFLLANSVATQFGSILVTLYGCAVLCGVAFFAMVGVCLLARFGAKYGSHRLPSNQQAKQEGSADDKESTAGKESDSKKGHGFNWRDVISVLPESILPALISVCIYGVDFSLLSITTYVIQRLVSCCACVFPPSIRLS